MFSLVADAMDLLCIISRFSVGQALKKFRPYYCLIQKQIPPKIFSVHPTDLDVGKIPDFDDIQIRIPTLSHP